MKVTAAALIVLILAPFNGVKAAWAQESAPLIADSSEHFLILTESLSRKQKLRHDLEQKLGVEIVRASWYFQTRGLFETYLAALTEVEAVLARDTKDLSPKAKTFEDGEACYRVATLDKGIDMIRTMTEIQSQIPQNDAIGKQIRASDKEIALLQKIITASAPLSGYCGVKSRTARYIFFSEPRVARGDHKSFLTGVAEAKKNSNELLTEIKPICEELKKSLKEDTENPLLREDDERLSELKTA